MSIEYLYVPLEKATLVSRKHVRDVSPPGMTLVKNAFISRSDNSITMRPDFGPTEEDVVAIGASTTGGTARDYLNSVSGIYGTDNLVFFTTYVPYSTQVAGALTMISGSYATGTVTGDSGSLVVTGTTTEWLQNAYRGQLMEFDNEGTYYVVDRVETDTRLYLTSALTASYADDTYDLHYNHNPRITNYVLNIQHYIGEMVYSAPTINSEIDPTDIHGPFHSLASEDYGTYTGTYYVDENARP